MIQSAGEAPASGTTSPFRSARWWRQAVGGARPGTVSVPLVLVLMLLAVELLVLYGPSVTNSLVADDWTIVEARASSLGAALALKALGPHFIPLQYLLLFILVQAVGVNPLAYHVVVLTLVWMSAGLVALLGRRLTGSLGVGGVAAALFLAYGTHYEAILWPAAGVSYTLATVLCLGGLLLYMHAHDASLDGRDRRLARLGFLGAVLLAPFAYPQGVMLLATAALYRLFVLEHEATFRRSILGQRARAWVNDLLVPALIVLGYAVLIMTIQPPLEPYVKRHGLVGHLHGYANSLLYVLFPGVGRTAIDHVWLSTRGALARPAIAGIDAFTMVVVVSLILLVAILWRGRPHHRVLGFWIALSVAAMVVSTGTVFSRHLFLVAAPASILWAALVRDLLRTLHSALAPRGARSNVAAVLTAVPSAVLLLSLVTSGVAYTIEQRDRWSAAAAATDDLISQVAEFAQANPSATIAYLLDPPPALPSPSGEPAWTLPPWSAAATIRMRFPGRFEQADVLYSREIGRRGWLVSAEQLQALSANPRVLLLQYNERANAFRVWQPPRQADDSAPILQPGAALAALDLVGNQPARNASVQAGQPIEVVGWAVAKPKQAAGGVIVTVDGEPRARAAYGQNRPDVSAALGAGVPTGVGFIATIPAEVLSPGRHTLGLQVLLPDGHAYAELADAAVIEVGTP